jgi:hypothetical protein
MSLTSDLPILYGTFAVDIVPLCKEDIKLSDGNVCKPGTSVSIVSEYGLEDRGSISDRGK